MVSFPADLEHLLQPLEALYQQQAVSSEHLASLLELQMLYPDGLIDSDWTNADQEKSQAVDELVALMQTWQDKRPESSPPAPIWKCDRETIAACPQLPLLLHSYQVLLSTVIANHGQIPQWITAAWWWGCASVVCQTSAASLANAIAGWAQRYRCAILYLQSPEMEQQAEILAAYRADLIFSHSAKVPQQVNSAWAIKDGFNWKQWQLPSDMQPWGKRARFGKKIMTKGRDRQR